MDKIPKGFIDIVITSPPYNTSRIRESDMYNKRYDSYQDFKTDQDYIDWTIDIFNGYDKILRKDGCVLYNLSYSSENTYLIWLVVADIIKRTNFTTSDCIVWKKSNAIPNNRSSNKLTRIVEYIFVFVRKGELKTFDSNKKVVSIIGKTGQFNYENVFNFIETKNNDGANELNKATFSVSLVRGLINMFTKPNSLIYDSFMGTGTTAVACLIEKMNYIGSEISESQYMYAKKRIEEHKKQFVIPF